ncbi:hypothetical protein EGW08_012060 [Elysia chlorotica]|uniref:Uncharacterized protein n=1 Tax=Elysia chlorotica TaxID=188477 RepID=A0A433TF48_ELYCH|nr:hypothetical protein EGW08_012060 [Elysia chlorotica]
MDLMSASQSGNTDFSRDHSHLAVLDDLDTMNKELVTLEEQFLRLGVRTHLLEVELATQFSPDLLEDQERAYETFQECELAVDEERQRVESLCTTGMEIEHCDGETHSPQETESFTLNKDMNESQPVEDHEISVQEKFDCEEQPPPLRSSPEASKDVEVENISLSSNLNCPLMSE